MDLIYNLAHKFASDYFDLDDLIGEASLAYCQAMEAFDQDRNIKFTTYAYTIISNHLQTYVTAWKRRSVKGNGNVNMDNDTDLISPDVQIEFMELLGSMPRKAKDICTMILDNPEAFVTSGKTGTRMNIVNHLRKMGWKWKDIQGSFRQITMALN